MSQTSTNLHSVNCWRRLMLPSTSLSHNKKWIKELMPAEWTTSIIYPIVYLRDVSARGSDELAAKTVYHSSISMWRQILENTHTFQVRTYHIFINFKHRIFLEYSSSENKNEIFQVYLQKRFSQVTTTFSNFKNL